MRRRYQRLPEEVRQQIIAAAAKGLGRSQILEQLDVSVGTYSNVLVPLGGVLPAGQAATPSTSRLSIADRIAIRAGLAADWSYERIGTSLPVARHKSTIWREVTNNGGRDGYQPMAAQQRAHRNASRTRPSKLATNAALRNKVIAGLAQLWSPEQIAARLRVEYGDDRSMTVSHETIYQSIYVQGRGELRRELARCLRTGRAKRKRRNRVGAGGSRIPDKVMISDRPAEVADRAVPGHWEGDLIVGRNGGSAIATLVERSSRYVLLAALPHGRTADAVRDALTVAVTDLPAALRRSLTWDQGVEMAQHVHFTVATGVPVYFCDPHSPWQRGSNENTNGLLRQYLPKGTDLSVHSSHHLTTIADSLNTRPRKTLGWQTPAQRLADLVASTP